jgi:outer membrane protein OmpA-like peptidoglycan-associated protein
MQTISYTKFNYAALRCFSLFAAFFLCMYTSKADNLKVGDKAPEIIEKDNNDKTVTLSSVNANKIVLVHFWSSKIAASRENHSTLVKYADVYKNTTLNGAAGLVVLAIGLEESKEGWEMAMAKDHLSNFVNTIDLNNLNSKTAEKYNVTKLPADYVLDQNGILLSIDPTMAELDNLFQKLTKTTPSAKHKDIFAKLLFDSEKKKKPLAHHKVHLMGNKGDTIKTTITNEYGDFEFKQINSDQLVSIDVENNGKEKITSDLYLANQNGVIITKFTKTPTGFQYKLIPADVVKMAPIEEEDVSLKMDAFAKSADNSITVTQNIYYPSQEYKITPQAATKLDAIAGQMKKNKALKLEIYSHTDANGDDAFNMELSKKRANAAADYLISKGIDKTRLKAIGMGESKILNRCANGEKCSEKEHEMNRRTEFKFSK